MALAPWGAFGCSGGDGAEPEDAESVPDVPVTVVPSRQEPAAEAPRPAPTADDAPASDPSSASAPAASSSAAAADAPAADAAEDDTLSFARDVWPIFNANCGPCHESQRAGGHNVGSDDVDISFEAAVGYQAAILNDLRRGRMPLACSGAPGSDGCITQAELDTISEWFAAGSPP